jgi:hypothetical protein
MGFSIRRESRNQFQVAENPVAIVAQHFILTQSGDFPVTNETATPVLIARNQCPT